MNRKGVAFFSYLVLTLHIFNQDQYKHIFAVVVIWYNVKDTAEEYYPCVKFHSI